MLCVLPFHDSRQFFRGWSRKKLTPHCSLVAGHTDRWHGIRLVLYPAKHINHMVKPRCDRSLRLGIGLDAGNHRCQVVQPATNTRLRHASSAFAIYTQACSDTLLLAVKRFCRMHNVLHVYVKILDVALHLRLEAGSPRSKLLDI